MRLEQGRHSMFSEGEEAIRDLDVRGGRASFSGMVTHKNAENIRRALRAQGIENLMLETDCPHVTPVPFRPKRNEPAFLCETTRFVSGLLAMDQYDLCAQTTQNAKQFLWNLNLKQFPFPFLECLLACFRAPYLSLDKSSN